MTTRREIVTKCGAGLAAIIAAGRAPAALIRSMLAARNGLMAGGKLSAKSYVQDGLVAMWDGIENAGWGVHDADATVWKDITGNGHDLVMGSLSSIKWLDKCARLTAPHSGYPFYTSSLDYRTVECMVHRKSNTRGLIQNADYEKACLFDTNGKKAIFPKCGGGGNRETYCLVAPNNTLIQFSLIYSETWPSSLEVSWYRDGSIGTTINDSNSFGSFSPGYFVVGARNDQNSYGLTGDIYFIRLYSRVLTADEIATNYAIDKARFNLPDAT